MFLISQGHTWESANSLPTKIKTELVYLWNAGVFGWKAETIKWYQSYNALEAVKRSIPMVKHRGKPLSLEQYAPQWNILERPVRKKTFSEQYADSAKRMLESGRMEVIDG